MMQNISILGSTGSIGRQTCAVAEHLGIKVCALAARRDIKLLESQARQFSPRLVAVYEENAAKALALALADTDIKVVSGEEGLIEAASMAECDCVVTAVSGSIGLRPTLAAIDAGKRIALANKETLVCAGEIVMARAREKGAEIIPVDSEHSAIFQSMAGMAEEKELKSILLTASGGPFRGKTREETYYKTPAEAISHPNWSMGAKISVDSATMMNKGLEFIEAMHLFSVIPDQIQVLIHPQSIIHSAVEMIDGSVIAQLAVPDMGLPIQYALTYPERKPSQSSPLNLFAGDMHFEKPDIENTPCLGLAMDCARRGGTAPCVMSAANEEAVGLFLEGKIPFGAIYECVAAALESIDIIEKPSLEEIISADSFARETVKRIFSKWSL
ncbi:MAG: 1-deoxy-D-xylulose-5-phosphate reductoisomerase [Oscillospiraceae bacterium]|nr:1-deoxy-D-xylulose-5-phosphate reductoisomerase [Oscillospiraceae bacterium]